MLRHKVIAQCAIVALDIKPPDVQYEVQQPLEPMKKIERSNQIVNIDTKRNITGIEGL
jgi:hypothetical protein